MQTQNYSCQIFFTLLSVKCALYLEYCPMNASRTQKSSLKSMKKFCRNRRFNKKTYEACENPANGCSQATVFCLVLVTTWSR